jgi:hypothetical protein
MKENLEKQNEYISFNKALQKLGQAQYISVFVNPSPKLHTDGTPYFSDIRIQGNPNEYYNISIHPDDIKKFIEKWLVYKKDTSPFYANSKVEDFLPD